MKVKNYGGKMVDRDRCRKIQGVYYEIGDSKVKDSGECYKINGKYHRFNNGLIEYDYEQGRYVLTNKVPLRRGVVGFDDKGDPIIGFFTSNITKNTSVMINERIQMSAINTDILESKYREHYNTGVFYPKESMSTSASKSIRKPQVNKRDLIYDSRFANGITKASYDKFYKPSNSNTMVDMLGDFLDKNGITFGVEFETSSGFIPERLCYKHGLIPLQDGSIGGLEYVTVPLSGKKGLYNLMEICELLKERTKYDFGCSMHVHIGGLKREVDNILAVNNIACIIEDEIYKLQPAYKRNSTDYGKGKNYSAPMNRASIDNFLACSDKTKAKALGFDVLFEYLSMGRSFSAYERDLKYVTSHPNDPNGNRKWNVSPRYKWFNIIPIIFANKQTVEFRQHNNTFDFFKIFSFILTSAIPVIAANEMTDKFTDPSFIKSLRNKSNIIETITKLVAKEDSKFTDELLDTNLKYLKERASVMSEMNKTNPEGTNEHKYYSKFTNFIDGK